MSGPQIIGLFEGYGGLTMGVRAALGGELVAYSEIEPAACRLLAHHHPGVPNLGDITAVDWGAVPVNPFARLVLTGGFPCQDVSSAGRRAGMRPGTRSGLWQHMAYAIDQLRPDLVVIENVRGLLSADAACDVEPCPWCLGDNEGRPLRALGAVLGGLADLGYDARWGGLRAADVGAPHGRYRVFVVAWPTARDATDVIGERRRGYTESERSTRGRLEAQVDLLFRTPTAQLAVNGGSQHPDKRKAGGHGPTLADEVEHLLPTSITTDYKAGTQDNREAQLRSAVHLLPTPRASDGEKGGPNQRGTSGDLMLPSAVMTLSGGRTGPPSTAGS